MAMQPPYPPQAPLPQAAPPKKKTNTCLVVFLVLLAISVPVLGIMGVLAWYGVRRYIATAKSVEAKSAVSAIGRAAVAAYERESVTDSLKSGGHHLCGSASPVPHTVPRGVTYTPSSAAGADFQMGSATAGWPCLKFSVIEPIRYQYGYVTGSGSGKSGAPASGFEASAKGDIDGNGVYSFFARGGDVRNGSVVLGTEIYVENELE